MPILTCHLDESIMIGGDITVTVVGARGQQVRLGVTAPRDVEVHREEIYYREHPERAPAGAAPEERLRSSDSDHALTIPVAIKRKRWPSGDA